MENLMIQNFTNELFGSVRSVVDGNGNPWFVGLDVARCLGYSNTNEALKDHVDSEDKIGGDGGREMLPPPITFIDSMGRQQTQYPVWINESGLYSLIFGSKLPAAKEFKHWVTSIVLPSMRKVGFTRSMQLLDEEKQRAEMRAITSEQSALAAGVRESEITDELFQIKDKIFKSNLPQEVKMYLTTYDSSYED